MNTIDAVKDKQVWNSDDVIRTYASVADLQKPEQTILNALRDRLPNWRMLDLGIGGGRTTVHFEPLTYEYHGTDYAERMVDACLQRFPNTGPRTRFFVLDATDMSGVPNQYYDFVLFSFNGIDCVAPNDREKVFREVQRVCKPGGYFAFSSHNLLYMPRMYRLKWYRRWRELLYQFYRIAMLLYYNGLPSQYADKKFAILRDGVEHFSLSIYYVQPEYQVWQLQRLGFRNVRVFSYKTGQEIDHSRLNMLGNDAWVYYLCEV